MPTTENTKYLVLAGRHIEELRFNKETGTLDLFGKRRSLAEYCQPRFDHNMNPWSITERVDERTDQEVFFDDSIRMLLQRCLLDDLVNKPARFELPADRVRLMVYTEVPDNFLMQISAEVKHTGRILFTKDLFLNGRPAGSQ